MKRALLIVSLILSFSSLSASAIVWNTPLTISTSGVNASDAHSATDASGNAVAVWVENGTVVANTLPFGGSWGTSTTLSVSTASFPRVVVDPSGNATAIWIDGGAITSATLPFGGSWSANTTLSLTGASTPHIAVDSSGDVVVVWAISGTIESATKLFGGSWPILPDTISTIGITSDSPRVSIGGPHKTAVAVWHGFNTIDTIYGVAKDLGGLWGTVSAISPATISSTNPRVAVGPAGNALATFFEYVQVSANLYSAVSLGAAFLPHASVWRASGTIKDTGIVNPANLQSNLMIDSTGNALATWTTSYDGSSYIVNSVVLQANGNLTALESLDSGAYIYGMDLSINAANNSILTYMNGIIGTNSLFVETWEMSVDSFQPNVWNNQTIVSTNMIAGYPDISSSYNSGAGTINGVLLWQSFDGTHTTIQSATGSGNVVNAPSSLMVVQTTDNLSIVTEYYNTLSWSASSDPNLVGYVVYRNGTEISTLNSSTLQFVDQNRKVGVSDTYGVAAFTSLGEQSVVVTITYP